MASGWERLRCGIEDRGSGSESPAFNVIRGRSADNRKALLNFSFPLEGKCHVVAKGCTRVSIPMKLTIVLLGPTSADLETLCRVSTRRRISVRIVSERSASKYQSAGQRGRERLTARPGPGSGSRSGPGLESGSPAVHCHPERSEGSW